MPLPLIAIAGAALVGAVGYAGYRYYQGLQSGRPPTLAELGRAALVGGVTGSLVGAAAVATTIGLGTAAAVAPSATYSTVQLVRVAEDFVDDGHVNGSDRSGASTALAAGATAGGAARPVFGGDAAARERLGAALEEGAAGVPAASRAGGVSDLERATAALDGISDQIEAQRRELSRTAPPPSPTRGMTAALRGGTGPASPP